MAASFVSNWASGCKQIRVNQGPTRFEKQVARLGISEQEYVSCPSLIDWVHRNADRYYVPEWLINRLRIHVTARFSDE